MLCTAEEDASVELASPSPMKPTSPYSYPGARAPAERTTPTNYKDTAAAGTSCQTPETSGAAPHRGSEPSAAPSAEPQQQQLAGPQRSELPDEPRAARARRTDSWSRAARRLSGSAPPNAQQPALSTPGGQGQEQGGGGRDVPLQIRDTHSPGHPSSSTASGYSDPHSAYGHNGSGALPADGSRAGPQVAAAYQPPSSPLPPASAGLPEAGAPPPAMGEAAYSWGIPVGSPGPGAAMHGLYPPYGMYPSMSPIVGVTAPYNAALLQQQMLQQATAAAAAAVTAQLGLMAAGPHSPPGRAAGSGSASDVATPSRPAVSSPPVRHSTATAQPLSPFLEEFVSTPQEEDRPSRQAWAPPGTADMAGSRQRYVALGISLTYQRLHLLVLCLPIIATDCA